MPAQQQYPPAPSEYLAEAAIRQTFRELREGRTTRDSALEYLRAGISHALTPAESAMFADALETCHAAA